ncbi:MAG TPA: histidine phosphatase family protein [Thermoanaerobaculia bacterium]|nr:histidine phosphatase family protein [Thermoanaerobaculia bacterium]
MIDQLILVRHGQTVENVTGIAQGWKDGTLSDLGVQQVAKLAERIAALKPNALFSSPLGRAVATASAIAGVTGLEIRTLDDLREVCLGAWEGRAYLDIRRDDYENYKRWRDDPDSACPDGESHHDVLRRMQRAFDTIASGANGEPTRAVVVTHGTAIRVGATLLLRAPLMVSRHLAQDNAAINIFDRRGDRFVLTIWNDTTHCQS